MIEDDDGKNVTLESTGRKFYAYGGIRTLSPGDAELGECSLDYGHDGGITFGGEWSDEPPLGPSERMEIAGTMIRLWLDWLQQ